MATSSYQGTQAQQAAMAQTLARSLDLTSMVLPAVIAAGYSNVVVNGDGSIYANGVALTTAQMAALLPTLPFPGPFSGEQ